MIRFIFVCMALVALSILTTAGQFMVDGIKSAKMGVEARNSAATVNQTATVEPSGPSFEEIYANAPKTDVSPESLNQIDAAAGGPDNGGFSGSAFTNTAPQGLIDHPVTVPAADEQTGAAPASN